MSTSDSLWIDALVLVIVLSAVPLGVCMGVGLLCSVLQAATQIQEQTLSFVPKLAGVIIVLAIFGPWMCQGILAFSREAFQVNHGEFSSP